MDDLSKAILLEGLKHEQTQCLRFIAEAKRNPQIKEGWLLEWAMKEAITVYRELRSGTIDYRTAVERYSEIAHVTAAYDTAAYMEFMFAPYTPDTADAINQHNRLLAMIKEMAA